jgi:hypothetical protein
LPVIPMPQERKASVVIAATHSNSMIQFVECDRRSDDQLQRSRRDDVARNRFPKSHSVADQGCFRSYLAEKHFAGFARNWGKNALFCAPRALDDLSRIDFVGHRQVTRDECSRTKFARVSDLVANFFGRTCTIVNGHFAPSRERRGANVFHHVGQKKLTIKEREAPPTCAVMNLRSRTGAKSGVNRRRNRLTIEMVLRKCERQATTPRWRFRVGRFPGQYRTLQETPI